MSIYTRNRIMTGLRFLFRVTLRRLDLAEEVYHIREPEKLPLVVSADEIKRLLAMASSLKTRVLLSLGYGCGLRASEIARDPRKLRRAVRKTSRRRNRPRRCPVQRWRSRISSAITQRHGEAPMPGTSASTS